MNRGAIILILVLFVTACSNGRDNGGVTYLNGTGLKTLDLFAPGLSGRAFEKGISIVSPENRSSFPPNIAAPEFEWEKGGDFLWLLIVGLPNGKNMTVLTKSNVWRPSKDEWEMIKQSSKGANFVFRVLGYSSKGISGSGTLTLRISPYPIDQYIVYRLANYTMEFNQAPILYYRDVSSDESDVFLQSARCTGCHIFSHDEKNLLISTRQSRTGATVASVDVVFSEGNDSFQEIKDEFGSIDTKGSEMGAWLPGDRKVLVQIVRPEERNITSGLLLESTFPFSFQLDDCGKYDIAVYDTDTHSLTLLPGASEPLRKEFFPSLSPDGKIVSFVVHTSKEGNLSACEDSDIYTVPYNDGKGGQAEPLPGASVKGVREYMQRYSPDGKWIVYDRVDGIGDAFTENSSLYMIPSGGGTPWLLECNSNTLDSNAAWSSNGRWIAFVSRRYNLESRIYFAEIDENGHAYPAFKLPNSEIESYMGFHHVQFVKEKRSLLMLMKNYQKLTSP
jgi:Tol biopolymer transport system component